jgi:pimeloyl-ACP methyl ester carboxylesterase
VLVEPFIIEVPDDVLDDLRRRIRSTRWPDAAPGNAWSQGVDREFLQNLLTYWADGFDWRAQEERLNRYDHCIADIDGIRLHFVGHRGYGERLPLILLHGWPSSFVEMLPLVDRLGDRFDLVVPSLPGYAFSSRPRRTGVDRGYVAEVCHRLMDGLGYPRYGAYGADFGAGVATHMALSHPDSLVGIHLSTAEMTPYTGPARRPFRWTSVHTSTASLPGTASSAATALCNPPVRRRSDTP